MAAGQFVSYLRVSTQRQGRSGLGLEAQREAVSAYLRGGRRTLLEEVLEVESGKRSDRPALAKALALCRIHRARLLVAKLDRLARNVAFISALMEAGVEFEAIDLPQANRLTIHVMAAMAEYEAAAISARTKAALAAAKARGTKLGGARWQVGTVARQGSAASASVRRARAADHRADLLPVIEAIRESGAITLRQVAAALNRQGVPAVRGGLWTAAQVRRVGVVPGSDSIPACPLKQASRS